MKSYGQYCGLARALDIVGDRWTLLIVRELAIRGGCRYSDLQYGLPGIATNLLADRLRQLEQAGVVEREAAVPPVAGVLFRLTPRGADLDGALTSLGDWGRPLVDELPSDAEFRAHWLVLPLRSILSERVVTGERAVVEIRTGELPITLRAEDGTIDVTLGAADAPNAVVTGPPGAVLALLDGSLPRRRARANGLRIDGEGMALDRVRGVER